MKFSSKIFVNTLKAAETYTHTHTHVNCCQAFKQIGTICLTIFLLIFLLIFNAHAVNNCTGATYYDSTTDTCLNCPTGYDYNTTAGKTDITECQIHCNAGTLNAEYTQLEYIESTGTQYIDTEYIPTAITRTEIDLKFTGDTYASSGGNIFFGTTRYSANFGGASNQGYKIYPWLCSSGTSSCSVSSFDINASLKTTRQTFVFDAQNKIASYGTASKSLSGQTQPSVPDGSIHLFGYLNSNTNTVSVYSRNAGMYIYETRIYEDGVLVRKFVPVRRNRDNVLGLYDTVTGQFFTNSGTGSFTAGPDTTTFIIGNGGSCVDVGIGYYAPASTINYGSTGTRTACPAGTTTSITNADSVSDCEPCGDDEIFGYVNGIASCIPAKFTVTTTDLDISKNTKFKFNISAQGTFYVDCGTDGTLSGTGASGNTITRGNVTKALYTCTYTTGGVKTIKFAGIATAYSTTYGVTTIDFYNNATPTLVGGISGSLGAMFPSLGSARAKKPVFWQTFYSCKNMTGSIPSNLFAGISGAPGGQMFYQTFYGCSGLTGSIPSNLFAGISGAPAQHMFYQTFYGCSGLTGSIPSGLFGNISGAPAGNMFMGTFNGCRGLTGSIPSGLFGNLSGAPAGQMFENTFSGCSGLTGSIPSGLFGSLSGAPAAYMFYQTFNNCRGLSGYIPKDLFENITSNSATSCFTNTFANTNLYTTCPCGTKPAATGWGDTTVNTRAVCEVGKKTNEHWDNGTCTTDCTLGVTRFKSSTGLDYPLLSDPTGVHNIYFGYNNGVCHVPLVSGAANNAINVSFNGETYHASQPDETPPVGFTGQPAPVSE